MFNDISQTLKIHNYSLLFERIRQSIIDCIIKTFHRVIFYMKIFFFNISNKKTNELRRILKGWNLQ